LIRAGSEDHGIDGHDHSAGLYHWEFDLVVGGFPNAGLATTKATNIPTARESFDAFMTDFQNAESTDWPLHRKKSPAVSRPKSAARKETTRKPRPALFRPPETPLSGGGTHTRKKRVE